MPFFAHTNEEVSQFLRGRSKAPLHITGNEHDHPRAETISLSKLKNVMLYEPEEMIISVQAGITLSELEERLRQKGQWLPLLLAEESSELTLGAAIAMDHYHPRAKSLGMLRTTILGGTFSTTDGEIFKSGSRVVKSVAGYDIHRAFCGSRGLFGIILDLTLKVQPMPEMLYHCIASLDSKEKIVRYNPSCIEESNGNLLVEFSGYKEDILSIKDELTSDITAKELSKDEWIREVRALIHTRDREREKNILSPELEILLQKVRSVFDPGGVLRKFGFPKQNIDIVDAVLPVVEDFPLRIKPLKKEKSE
jgi:hypothetical protein